MLTKNSDCFSSELIARNGFTAGSGHQRGYDLDGYVGSQETDRAIGKTCVGPARMKAVELAVVGAVDGTLARMSYAIRRGPSNRKRIIESGPPAAEDRLVFACRHPQPLSRPAGILRQQDRVGSAIPAQDSSDCCSRPSDW